MKQLLIIDDSLSIRELVKNTLENHNFSVSTAENGEQGLKLARNNYFDLIISDINMPIMNGFQFTIQVRKLEQYKFTPILILTTEQDLKKKMQGKQAGATGWLVKPIIAEQLINTVFRVI